MEPGNKKFTFPILKVKLNVPVLHPSFITRKALTPLLDKACTASFHLTLISAPPGYGKTTLVVNWLQTIKQPFAWINLDKNDNNPVRFLGCLAEALKSINEETGTNVESLLGSPQLPSAELIGSIISHSLFTIEDTFILVLDDYHLISDSTVHEILQFLLKSKPNVLHLIILTREDPPFLLSQLRVKNQLTEIRATDLKFSLEEISEFLPKIIGMELQSHIIESLIRKTEGWAAGIQLAALSLKEYSASEQIEFIKDFSGTSRFIIDYLMEEVLQDRGKELQQFLYKTALLERFCAELCNYIIGTGNSEQIISKLENENLFILSLDNQNVWYRYHHLFADFLKSRTPADCTALYKKAATWFEQKGLKDEAVKYILLAGDNAEALRIIKQDLSQVFQRGDIITILNWIKALPPEMVNNDYEMSIYKSWALFFNNNISELQVMLKSIEDILMNNDTLNRGRLISLKSWIADLQEQPDTLELAESALTLLDDRDQFFKILTMLPLGHATYRKGMTSEAIKILNNAFYTSEALGSTFIAAIVLHNLLFILNENGQRNKAEYLCIKMLNRLIEDYGDLSPVIGLIYIPLAVLYYESNQLEKARELAEKGLALCKDLNMDYILAEYAETTLIYILMAEGNFKKALSILEDMEFSINNLIFSTVENIRLIKAEIALRQDDIAEAKKWLKSIDLPEEMVLSVTYEKECLVYCKYLIQSNSLEEGEKLLSHLLDSAEKGERYRQLISIYIQYAFLYKKKQNEAKALTFLSMAIRLAEQENFFRIFLDEGKEIIALLPKLKKIASRFVNVLIFSSRNINPSQAEYNLKNENGYQAISRREVDVLKLISEGLSNNEIAAKLFISPGTVKWHINNIFTKLNVKNRTQAILEAKKKDLIH